MDFISPAEIKRIASRYGFVFKKGLGQNFLSSQSVLEKIADAAEIENEGVIEIGPGFGVLTNELAKRAEKVLALEIDDRLIPILRDTLSEYDNVKVINKDVLKTDIAELIKNEFGDKRVSVAANLPYYITTPIITSLIENKLPLKNLVVMIQKEVADRITAQPGTKDYGAISVLCQYYTEPGLVCNVGAELFVPPPKVDSAVVKMTFRDEPTVAVKDEKMFFRTVKAAFSQRRKTLLNCLAANFPINKSDLTHIMESVDISPTRRGETLSLEEFAKLSEAIC
mgnify:CR=1 FL=1